MAISLFLTHGLENRIDKQLRTLLGHPTTLQNRQIASSVWFSFLDCLT